MKLRDILSVKGSAVHSISPEAALQDAVRSLVEHRIGALIVCRADAAADKPPAGIITERDILHACAAGRRPLNEATVAEAMTTALVVGAPDDDVATAMGIMTTRRIRHLPVLADGRLVGLVSIGDLVKAQLDLLAMENRFMKDYIDGPR